MRATLALIFVLFAAPVFAEQFTSDLAPTTKDLGGGVRELTFAVSDLQHRIEDIFTVKEAAKEITIELPADILFNFDKADIRPEAIVALSAAANFILASSKGTVKIFGHTDSKGESAYNLGLSTDRAQSVKTWLIEKGGLGKIKFMLKGWGSAKPTVPNTKPDGSDDPDGRQLNRRVEILFSKK
jgi:outer membrane protein OmpA-like peptidoglycan-associated protein